MYIDVFFFRPGCVSPISEYYKYSCLLRQDIHIRIYSWKLYLCACIYIYVHEMGPLYLVLGFHDMFTKILEISWEWLTQPSAPPLRLCPPRAVLSCSCCRCKVTAGLCALAFIPTCVSFRFVLYICNETVCYNITQFTSKEKIISERETCKNARARGGEKKLEWGRKKKDRDGWTVVVRVCESAAGPFFFVFILYYFFLLLLSVLWWFFYCCCCYFIFVLF